MTDDAKAILVSLARRLLYAKRALRKCENDPRMRSDQVTHTYLIEQRFECQESYEVAKEALREHWAYKERMASQ